MGANAHIYTARGGIDSPASQKQRRFCKDCLDNPGASPVPGRLDQDGRCDSCSLARLVESARGVQFPRAAIALRAAGLADRCRVAASVLDAAAGDAATIEPATLRRRIDGIVRALLQELGREVTP